MGISMLTLLQIDCFRGLRDLSFESLSRINVVTGFNNSGKTTVLEALYLLFANREQIQTYPNVFRSAQTDQAERYEHFWRWLLPDGNLDTEARLHTITDDKKKAGNCREKASATARNVDRSIPRFIAD
jgi:recombinational DNA repair ATPase RecF